MTEMVALAEVWEFYRTHPAIVGKEETLMEHGDPLVSYLDRQGTALYSITRVAGTYFADVDDGDLGHVIYRGKSLAEMLAAIFNWRATDGTVQEKIRQYVHA